MNFRKRLLITPRFHCRLPFALALVTSQLLFNSPAARAQAPPNLPAARSYQDVTIRALSQEKDGDLYKLHGSAELDYAPYILRADDMTYDRTTGEATADGHVVLDGGPYDEHIQATHATYNVRSETGHFEHVTGTVGLRLRGVRLTLTSTNPFAFTGKVVNKVGPGHFVVYDGTITTCRRPRPKWLFDARKADVEAAGNARIYHSLFRVEGVPVFYFPFATHPIEKQRESGFSIPNIGRSSTKGNIVGESMYWAINRSMDLALGTEYYSMRGWAPHGEFRARPTDSSFVDLNYTAVLDRGIGPNHETKQGGQEVRFDAESDFTHNIRGVADIDYLTSYVYRLAFNEVFTQAVNSEVKSQAFLSNTTNGFFSNLITERYQNFESTVAGDVITITQAPSFEFAGVDRQIGRSPFYWSYNAALGALSRSEPLSSTGPSSKFTTGVTGRFDLNPTLSLPLLLRGWSLRPEVSLHDTFYTRRFEASSSATGEAVGQGINRKAVEGSVELRPPPLERVFGREFLGRKWKHVIEPNATYRYVTGVNNFDQILRFDERDILSDTNEVEYGVVNRLYAKRTSRAPEKNCEAGGIPGLAIARPVIQSRIPWERQTLSQQSPCEPEPQVREVVTWELAQKYYLDPTFGGALVPGTRNVLAATADLTGIAFLTDARRLSPVISRLRIQTSNRADAEWDLDYDIKKGRINASTALINYHLGEFTIGGGGAFLQTPGEALASATNGVQRFDQLRLLFGYGHPNKRGFTGAINTGYDAHLGFVQYASIQTAYNWDCCGVNLEYRRFALGSVRNENQFRFTFALANIGALGNLRRQERLF
jgi:LPS-assembly protein